MAAVRSAQVRSAVVEQPPVVRGRPKGYGKGVWRAVGGFGAVLSLVALVDMLLVWYPLGFGNVAWEFGVVDQSFSGLPLLTMGLAALVVSALALGIRWWTVSVATVVLVIGLSVLAAYTLYLLSVPIILGMTPPEVAIGVKKAIVKTSVMAVSFSGLYVVAAVLAIRNSRTPHLNENQG